GSVSQNTRFDPAARKLCFGSASKIVWDQYRPSTSVRCAAAIFRSRRQTGPIVDVRENGAHDSERLFRVVRRKTRLSENIQIVGGDDAAFVAAADFVDQHILIRA